MRDRRAMSTVRAERNVVACTYCGSSYEIGTGQWGYCSAACKRQEEADRRATERERNAESRKADRRRGAEWHADLERDHDARARAAADTERKKTENRENRECPQCAETIKIKAKVCRYCSYELPDWEVQQKRLAKEEEARGRAKRKDLERRMVLDVLKGQMPLRAVMEWYDVDGVDQLRKVLAQEGLSSALATRLERDAGGKMAAPSGGGLQGQNRAKVASLLNELSNGGDAGIEALFLDLLKQRRTARGSTDGGAGFAEQRAAGALLTIHFVDVPLGKNDISFSVDEEPLDGSALGRHPDPGQVIDGYRTPGTFWSVLPPGDHAVVFKRVGLNLGLPSTFKVNAEPNGSATITARLIGTTIHFEHEGVLQPERSTPMPVLSARFTATIFLIAICALWSFISNGVLTSMNASGTTFTPLLWYGLIWGVWAIPGVIILKNFLRAIP